MVKYTHLNRDPGKAMEDLVKKLNASAKGQKTKPTGVKDLGESGDLVWPRPDGTPVSVRDVDLDLADARQRIKDAEGDLAGARDRIDTALDAEGHIREDEIFRNATLLGETVVEQINVTEKLVGVDGVFTGTVDFENVNVTGELLAGKISGEHIYGTILEGGEIRTGGDGSRGSFLLGDRAYVSPFDGYTTPGIQFAGPGSMMIYPPGIGVNGGGVQVSGGRSINNARSDFVITPRSVDANVYASDDSASKYNARFSVNNRSLLMSTGGQPDFDGAEIYVNGPDFIDGVERVFPGVRLQAARNGRSAKIQAFNGTATMESSDGTTRRSLRIDDSGVWVKRWRNDGSGQPDNFNLLGDDWGVVTLGTEWSPRTSGGYYGGLRVRRLGGSVEINGAVQGGSSGSKIGTIADPQLRPKYDTFVVTTLAAGGLGQAFVGSNGDIMHSYGPSRPAFLAINVSIPLN